MMTENKIFEEIYSSLDEIGILQNLSGYHYVAHAISLLVENPSHRLSMTKEVYPRVAEICNSKNDSSVERAMRHAIERAFYSVSPEVIYGYFGNSIDPEKGKVTNSQFIYTVANRIHRRLYA